MMPRLFPWTCPAAEKAFPISAETEEALLKAAVFSKIRLIRNVRGIPFPPNASNEQKQALLEQVRAVLGKIGKWNEFDLDKLTDEEKVDLVETKTVLPEQTQNVRYRSVFISEKSPWLSITVNGNDHLVIQSFAPGADLIRLYAKTERLEDALAEKLDMAYHPQFGFTANDPADAGTGLSASVMLHLPATGITGNEKGILDGLHAMGLSARGFFGDANKFPGNLYEIFNRTKMGESERELLTRMTNCVLHIAQEEIFQRDDLRKKHPLRVLDFCFRSKAVLEEAHLISTVEAMNALSGLRLADESKIFSLPFRWDAMLINIQPGRISERCGTDNGPEHRAAERATLLRMSMTGA